MNLQARQFEVFSLNESLAAMVRSLFEGCEGMRFPYSVGTRNNNQITSDFDGALEERLREEGIERAIFERPKGKGYTEDFAFAFDGRTFVVEAEKSNSDKILYDFLKFHFYLDSGADAVILLLPKNWPHRSGEVDMFAQGCERLLHCHEIGFGSPAFFESTVIVGYEQATEDGRRLTAAVRRELVINQP